MCMPNNTGSEDTSRLMLPYITKPKNSDAANRLKLCKAKFQLATSFFSLRNDRKNTDIPTVSTPAAWAIVISVMELSSAPYARNSASAISKACPAI